MQVLCVAKPLSLQAHPDKALAETLRAGNPGLYPDSNHKPEMIVAMTPFTAMCGFRHVERILRYFDAFPELQLVIGPEEYGTCAHVHVCPSMKCTRVDWTALD